MPDIIGIKGIFSVLKPFIIEDVEYTCSSMSTISNILRSGDDPYLLYYAHNNISIDAYNNDKNNDVAIVTLESEYADTIYIPETYIAKTPIEVSYRYVRKIISIDLGDVPEGLDVNSITPRLEEILSAYTGCQATVEHHIAASTTFYGKSAHMLKEAARLANLSSTSNPYKIIKSLHQSIAGYRKRIADLEALVISLKT
jgi:hypothetical protein